MNSNSIKNKLQSFLKSDVGLDLNSLRLKKGKVDKEEFTDYTNVTSRYLCEIFINNFFDDFNKITFYVKNFFDKNNVESSVVLREKFEMGTYATLKFAIKITFKEKKKRSLNKFKFIQKNENS